MVGFSKELFMVITSLQDPEMRSCSADRAGLRRRSMLLSDPKLLVSEMLYSVLLQFHPDDES